MRRIAHARTLATSAVSQSVARALWRRDRRCAGTTTSHLHTAALTGKVIPMLQRLRISAITTFCAAVIFGLAVGFLGRTADPQAPFNAVARVHPEIDIAYHIINDAFIISILLLLVGGIPVILSAFRRTVLRDRRNPFMLFALRWRDV